MKKKGDDEEMQADSRDRENKGAEEAEETPESGKRGKHTAERVSERGICSAIYFISMRNATPELAAPCPV